MAPNNIKQIPERFLTDIRSIIEHGRQTAYAAVGQAAIMTYPQKEILHDLVQNLTWTHIRRILSVSNPDAQLWYLKAASGNMWSTTELDRNIATQYYERRLAAQLPVGTGDLPQENDKDPLEYIKNPVVAEFMGFHRDTAYSESDMEQALIDNLERFILELKIHKLTHQDIGQLDMYVRMYDDMVKGEDDQPTIGVLLCTDTDKTIARYSVLHESDQLYAAKYLPYMPTEEELRREIEQQKQFFLEQHNKG